LFVSPAVRTRWGIVFLAVIAGIAGGLQTGKVPPALPAIRADLGLGLVAGGMVHSMFNVISAVLGIMAGVIADRMGHRTGVLAGIVFMAAGSFLGWASPSGESLFAARFIEGIGFVLVVVAAPSIIVEATTPASQRLALGLWGTYMPTGMTLVLVAAPLILQSAGWRGLWLANAAILALLAVAFLIGTRGVGTRPVAHASLGRAVAGMGTTVKSGGPWLLAGCFGVYTTQWMALAAWMPTFLIDTLGFGTAFAANFTALMVFVNIFGNLLGTWLLHRGAARWLLILCAFIIMGLSALGVFSDLLANPVRLVLALAFSGLSGILPPSILSGVPVHAPAPSLVGTTNGVVVQGANIGTFAGPPLLAALVAALGGWQQASWLMPILGCAGIGLALTLRAVERRP
jgi:MFS family permease